MKYHQLLAKVLRDTGTDVVFGVLGDANLFAMNAFQNEQGGRYVSMAHEGSAVLAAAGYASTTGRLGVATVTHGPALTNTVTALVDAVRSRTPVLLLAGDTDFADRDGLQVIDQASIVAPTGAGWELAQRPDMVLADVQRASRRALAERRPVVLNIPVTFQWQDVPDPGPAATPLLPARAAAAPDQAALEDVAAVIAASRRPIVLAGLGASEAGPQLEALATAIGAPVATTLRGQSLFKGNPHDLGLFGTLSHDIASDVISRADCILAFGASLNAKTTAKRDLVNGKRVVQVDDRIDAFNASRAEVMVLGDAGVVAEELAALLKESEIGASGFASPDMAAALEEQKARRREGTLPAAGIDLTQALRLIEDTFEPDRTLVVDDGRFMVSTYREVSAPSPRAYVHCAAFASIGLAVASAVGAQIGAPERPALVICGDGGFMSAGLTELNSAVRHGTDMVVVVVNDMAYGAEHIQFSRRELDPAITMFDWPPLAPVAEALGCIGIEVRDHQGLEEALVRVAERDRPVLIDLIVDPASVPAPGH